MKSSLTAAEYHDAPRDIRGAVDAWLEKIDMLHAGVVEIKVIHRLKDDRALVEVWYYIRNAHGRIAREADGSPIINAITMEADMPPLGFFEVVTK